VRIERLEVVRLYGSFTKTVDFDPGLNLLVGINGSGKTSILNCIEWLTKPNLARLACTQFHSISMNMEHSGKRYTIHAHRTSQLLTVEVSGGGLNGDPITVDIERPTASIRNEQEMIEALSNYSGLSAEPHEKKTWNFLRDLPEPLSVSLDRTIAAESEGEYYYEGRSVKLGLPKSPLSKVIDVTRRRYAAYTQKVKTSNEELKSKLIVSAFTSPLLRMRDTAIPSVSVGQLEELKSKVTALLYSSVEVDKYGADSISQYFDEARHILSMGGKDDSIKNVFYAQYRQIHGLAEAFKGFEDKSAKAYESIGSYLDSLNSFFIESKKHIGFNETDGALGFQTISKNGDPSGHFFALDRMSSGERQLLILITFLAFISKKNHIFIVDEPELSLHPRWQRGFVSAVIAQAPVGTQVIMATHSPEIVSKHREKCVVLDV